MTVITGSGSYGPGVYTLGANLQVSSGDCLVLTGDVTLTAGVGNEIRSTATGNAWDYGIQHSGGVLNISGIKITGFRVGIKASGANSVLTDIDISDSRYMGVWIDSAGTKMQGGSVTNIGGVTDEPYAIAVQVGGVNGVEISDVAFSKIYRQANGPGAIGDHTGEGLAVNFSSDATNGKLLNSTFENDEFRLDTIGVFLGAGGGHLVDGFTLTNVFKPVQRSSLNNSQVTNTLAHFNTVVEEPPPGTFGTVLTASINSYFGSVDGKTIRVRVPRSALTGLPSGAVVNVRVTLRGHATEGITYTKLYIGHAGSGASASGLMQLRDIDTNLPSWTVPAGGTVVVGGQFVYDKTSDIMLSSSHFGGTSADNLAANAAFSGASTCNKYGDEAGTGSVSGFTCYSGYLSGVEKIEVDGF